MARSHRSTAFLIAFLATGLLLSLLVLLRTDGGRAQADAEPAVAVVPQTAGPAPVELEAPPVVPLSAEELGDTTVLWPVSVELELVRAAYLPTAEGVVPVGSGRSARLSGRITDSRDQGTRAEVHFVSGTNEGRTLVCDATGRFGATDLYPGLSIVEVRGPGIIGSRREVRLRQGKESLLNIGYGRPAAVFGQVVDKNGEGLQGARISFDGHVVYSATDGEFYVPAVAGGQALVEVSYAGLADHRELVYVTAGQTLARGRLKFALRPAASLTLSVPDRVGGPGPVYAYLLSAQARDPSRDFPWYRLNPVEIPAGGSVTLEGLPAKVVKIHAFRAGAKAPQKIVNLRAGRPQTAVLNLESAPKITGVISVDGRPSAGAVVTLEAPDQVRAMLGYFREPGYFLETEVMPLLPPARQELVTGPDGRFTFSSWGDVAPVRYVEAVSADGTARGGKLVRPGESEIEIALEGGGLGDSTLVLSFPDRWQGLPVELRVDGTTYDPEILPPHEPLRVEDLPAGTWRIRASWHGLPVLREEEFELSGIEHREIPLIPEAIDGQDEETWRRAGREFPFGG